MAVVAEAIIARWDMIVARLIRPPLALTLLFTACRSVALPALPAVDPAAATESASASTTPLASSSDGLVPIPLHVGYAVGNQWLELYFTDPSNPASAQISGGPDGPLAAAIDSARLSVHTAIYSLSLNSVRDALIRAHRRGVDVRVVMESDDIDRADPQALKEAGIPLLGDRRQGLMHNKFLIIDRSEVWTGSMNFTDSGAYADNNNLLRIRSTKAAEDYEAEFDEMFSDDHFGPDLGQSTPYPHVTVGGTPLDMYFSPDDHVQEALVRLLKDARSTIYFLAFSFTSDPLGDAIRDRAAAGVKVTGVMDADQISANIGTQFDSFRAAGLAVRVDGNPGEMHHKVMIIDGSTVVTGSYNFSAGADNINDENLLVIHSAAIAAQFTMEFGRVYDIATP